MYIHTYICTQGFCVAISPELKHSLLEGGGRLIRLKKKLKFTRFRNLPQLKRLRKPLKVLRFTRPTPGHMSSSNCWIEECSN